MTRKKPAVKRNVLLSVDVNLWEVVQAEARANFRTVTAQANMILHQWADARLKQPDHGQQDVEIYARKAEARTRRARNA